MARTARLAACLLAATVVGLSACSGAAPDEDTGEDLGAAKLAPTTVTALFNAPTAAKGHASAALFDELGKMVDATPAGATIRVAVVTLGASNPVIDKLVEARKRGVRVQMVPDRDAFAQPGGVVQTKLLPALGTDTSKGSWIRACGARADGTPSRSRASCNGEGDRGNNHNKFVLFSKTGGDAKVVWVGSTNLTSSQLRAWNDAVVFRNAPETYGKFLSVWRTFEDNVDAPATPARPDLAAQVNGVADGQYVAFAPDARSPDFLESFLDGIRCDREQGHYIRISMHEISNSRAELARALAKKSCRVDLVVSYMGWRIRETFAANANLHYERYVDPDPSRGFMNHEKYVIARADFVAGRVGGRACTPSSPCKDARVVLTGSHNWSDEGLSKNDESMVVVSGQPQVFQAFLADFDALSSEAVKTPARHLPRDDEWAWCTSDAQCASGRCDRVVSAAPGGYTFCR
jgi:hypothetical protein